MAAPAKGGKGHARGGSTASALLPSLDDGRSRKEVAAIALDARYSIGLTIAKKKFMKEQGESKVGSVAGMNAARQAIALQSHQTSVV